MRFALRWFLPTLALWFLCTLASAQTPRLPASRPSSAVQPPLLPSSKAPASRPSLCRDIQPLALLPTTRPAKISVHEIPQSVALSADGTLLAAGYPGGISYDYKKDPTGRDIQHRVLTGRILVWDITSGKLQAAFRSYGDLIKIALSPQKTHLAFKSIYTLGDGVSGDLMGIYDLRTKQRLTLKNQRGYYVGGWSPSSFAFTQEGGLLLHGVGNFYYYDPTQAKLLELELPGVPRYQTVRDLALSPDQTKLAWLSDSPLRTKIAVCQGPQGWLSKARLFPSSDLATPTSRPASFFSLAKVTCTFSREHMAYDGAHLSFSPDSQDLLVTSRQGAVYLLPSLPPSEPRRTFQALGTIPLRSGFSPDRRTIAALSHARRWRTWRYDHSQKSGFSYSYGQSANFSSLTLWDRFSGEKRACLHLHDCFLYTVYARFRGTTGPEEDPQRFAFSPDGKLLYVACQTPIAIDLSTSTILRSFPYPHGHTPAP